MVPERVGQTHIALYRPYRKAKRKGQERGTTRDYPYRRAKARACAALNCRCGGKLPDPSRSNGYLRGDDRKQPKGKKRRGNKEKVGGTSAAENSTQPPVSLKVVSNKSPCSNQEGAKTRGRGNRQKKTT